MEIGNIPAPLQRQEKARWMNDNDLNRPLVIEELNELENDTMEIIFTTPLLEKIRRTVKRTSPEYTFLYNTLTIDKSRVVKYIKKDGFRIPTVA